MPVIRPVSDLRNKFSSISEEVRENDEPIFLTKNGVGDMVVMSIEHYERQMAKIDLYRDLEIAEREIEAGARGKPAAEVFKNVLKR
jgi:prevent-host-death family protein